MIVFVCAEPNRANKTVISDMVMRLLIGIIDIYSTYAYNTPKDANVQLFDWLLRAKLPIFLHNKICVPGWVQRCEERNETQFRDFK
jgi:hypothetical protein